MRSGRGWELPASLGFHTLLAVSIHSRIQQLRSRLTKSFCYQSILGMVNKLTQATVCEHVQSFKYT